jgi:hypothetical protein
MSNNTGFFPWLFGFDKHYEEHKHRKTKMTNEERNKIKPFHKQLCECDELGYRKETVFYSFKDYPNMLPAFPKKEWIDKIKSGEWTGNDFVKCDRFTDSSKEDTEMKGICRSSHPECRKLRGWPHEK